MGLTGSRQFDLIMKCLMMITGLMFLGGLVFFLPATVRRHHSTQWPTSPGIISASGLKIHQHKPHHEPSYTPNVSYSYVVAGIHRVGTRIDFADVLAFHKEDALRWLENNYSVGKPVTVYHHPSNPDLAVLVPGAGDWIINCAWYLATTAACAIFCFAINRRNNALRAPDLTPDQPRLTPA